MKKLKTIAMYLPQFYETPENNQWWGEGYTDWTAVRKAEKYFEGHNQPREPLNQDYYNLLDKSTMERQAKLAQKYGLDGFCFYHYYFKNGRKILEKPAENLLSWKDIEMPFCFCWANESWVRTWSKIENRNKNIWSDKYEVSSDAEREDGLLLEQKYDREEAWKQHFEYLLPFLEDSRYIRFQGAPVFLIYRPGDIFCLAEMMYYWKLLAKEKGLEGLYIIGLNTREKLNGLDAVLINGPGMYSWDSSRRGCGIEADWQYGIQNYQYEEVWKNAIAEPGIYNCRTYFGAFTDFDDTPRRGKNGGYLRGTSVELFDKYLYLIMKKNRKAGNEYLFINAFNEWGEGMYLEPDTKNGYKFLEVIREKKEIVNKECFYIDDSVEKNTVGKKEESLSKAEKSEYYIAFLDKWMTLREQQRHLSDYLKRYGYRKVAVYGMGVFGRHLVAELLEDGIDVKYAIDKRDLLRFRGTDIYKLNPDLMKVDAIIVTPICEFHDIWKEIRANGITYSIVSLKELMDDILRNA